jgi:hypothetical protein
MTKPIKLYAGFSDGKLHWNSVVDCGEAIEVPALFEKRNEARTRYEDVRVMELREAPRRRRNR